MLSPETQARIAQLRQKTELTVEDCREVVRLYRGDRTNAQSASEGSKRKLAKAEIKSADDMLSELTEL